MKDFGLIVLLVIILSLSGCSNPTGPGIHSEPLFSGIIQNWTLGSGYTAKLVNGTSPPTASLDSSIITAAGYFNFSNPSFPDTIYGLWYNVKEFNCVYGAVDSILISNPATKLKFIGIAVYDLNNNYIGQIRRNSVGGIPPNEPYVGLFSSIIWYVNQNADITGYSRCTRFDSGGFDTLFIKNDYNIKYKSGFNRRSIVLTDIDSSQSPQKGINTYTYTTDEPIGGKWYLYTFL